MKDQVIIFLFHILPKGFVSRIFGLLTVMKLPSAVLNSIINYFCNTYKVNKDEIQSPAGGFKTLDQFFTRKLKPGIHKIDINKKTIVSPVDARIDEFGKIAEYSIIQAKNINYSLKDLVPSDMAESFLNGSFITLYLSPSDYHRIHSPVNGKIAGYFNIPGKLFPVRELIVNNVKGLFSVNERIITYIENSNGIAAVCKIGAMNVGKISLSYSDIRTNKFFRKQTEFFYSKSEQPPVKKGDEIGTFHLGSTVILLFPENNVAFKGISKGQKVRVGQKIAYYEKA